jgi:hypothetical protein
VAEAADKASVRSDSDDISQGMCSSGNSVLRGQYWEGEGQGLLRGAPAERRAVTVV